tara:strand:+ start:320 stop:1909 length:1590 start_codon:yes stop_codon:yes gene_type:complete
MPYRSDDRLELALRASNEGIWDWNLASDEIHYSGRILRFFGRRREEMPNLFRAVELVHEADRDLFVTRIEAILKMGGEDLLAIEPRIRVANGSGEWNWFRIRGVVVRDAEGHATRVAGSMINITPRKLVEQELLEERHLMRLLIDNVPLNIYFKDRESKFKLVNKSMAKWNGFGRPEDVVGKSDQDLFSEDHANEALRDERKILESGEPILGYVEKETTAAGGEAWVLTTKMPLIDRVGAIIGTFGVSSDVTELVRTQQSLAETAAALKRRNDEMEEELALAREVQQALLPHDYPTVPAGAGKGRLKFGHRYIPISGLAGDFFEVFSIGDQCAGLFICDVMGHGVRSALIVSMLRGLAERIHQVAEDPGEFLGQLNSGLSAILTEAEMTMFATAFLAVIDFENGELRYASAGHPAPIMRSAEGEAGVLPMGGRGKGTALGLFPDATYESQSLKLSMLKQLMLFTDGIIEVENQDGEAFLQNRLVQAVSEEECSGVDTLLERVLDRVLAFTESQRFDDDVCLLAVEIEED